MPTHTDMEQVILQVGERRFSTTIGSLVERSQYFRAYFSGKFLIDKLDDGCIFIDGDATAFEHIIGYIRRGVFPLAFDSVKGHDYSLYTKIIEEAKYFQCPLLISWLEDECYYECVTWRILSEVQKVNEPTTTRGDGSVKDWKFIPCSTIDQNIYICPRGIDVHRGNPQNCGRQCRNAQGDRGPVYDIERATPEWLIVKTKLDFNRGWMTDFGESFLEHLQRKSLTSLDD